MTDSSLTSWSIKYSLNNSNTIFSFEGDGWSSSLHNSWQLCNNVFDEFVGLGDEAKETLPLYLDRDLLFYTVEEVYGEERSVRKTRRQELLKRPAYRHYYIWRRYYGADMCESLYRNCRRILLLLLFLLLNAPPIIHLNNWCCITYNITRSYLTRRYKRRRSQILMKITKKSLSCQWEVLSSLFNFDLKSINQIASGALSLTSN